MGLRPANKSLTFTIRSGVKFSDGSAMTAADVAYTFNMIKKYPAMDLTGVWSVLSSVSPDRGQPGDDGLQGAAVPYFYYIADQVPIVPQAHLVQDLEPDHLPEHSPGRHRPVHGEPVPHDERHVHRQQELLAAR